MIWDYEQFRRAWISPRIELVIPGQGPNLWERFGYITLKGLRLRWYLLHPGGILYDWCRMLAYLMRSVTLAHLLEHFDPRIMRLDGDTLHIEVSDRDFVVTLTQTYTMSGYIYALDALFGRIRLELNLFGWTGIKVELQARPGHREINELFASGVASFLSDLSMRCYWLWWAEDHGEKLLARAVADRRHSLFPAPLVLKPRLSQEDRRCSLDFLVHEKFACPDCRGKSWPMQHLGRLLAHLKGSKHLAHELGLGREFIRKVARDYREVLEFLEGAS